MPRLVPVVREGQTAPPSLPASLQPHGDPLPPQSCDPWTGPRSLSLQEESALWRSRGQGLAGAAGFRADHQSTRRQRVEPALCMCSRDLCGHAAKPGAGQSACTGSPGPQLASPKATVTHWAAEKQKLSDSSRASVFRALCSRPTTSSYGWSQPRGRTWHVGGNLPRTSVQQTCPASE